MTEPAFTYRVTDGWLCDLAAEHVRAARPDWVIGQASWGLRLDEPAELEQLQRISEAVDVVYGVTGAARDALTDCYARAEAAYYSRSSFEPGSRSLSLEPLIWRENPAAPGPPIYLRDRLSAEARAAYAGELEQLKRELAAMERPDQGVVSRTLACIEATLRDIAALG